LRGRAGPALAGGFERRWAGSTDIFKVLSNSGRPVFNVCLTCCMPGRETKRVAFRKFRQCDREI
jgi:hypothetical protein